MENESQKPQGFYQKYFYHPNFNVIIGILGTLLGVFGVYAYYSSIKEPALTYYVSSNRSPILKNGSFRGGFSVTYFGQQIKTDLSAATIQIWNAGKQPIRKEDILKPIRVHLANNAPIYQTEIIQSRDVIGVSNFQYDTPETNSATLTWNILEKDDCIKLQIIYAGSVDVPIVVSGLVVGQKGGLINMSNQENSVYTKIYSTLAIPLFFLLVVPVFRISIRWENSESKFKRLIATPMFILTICAGAAMLTYLVKYLSHPITPPFGF